MTRPFWSWFDPDDDCDRDAAGRARRPPRPPPWPGGPGHPGAGGAGGPPWGGPPWGGPWAQLFGSMFGRGPRARRGDVRAAILTLLAEQPRNGYQIMQELEARSRGTWRPSSGSVYPTLQQLEDEGLVHAEASATGSGGRSYALTAAGQAYVAEHRAELDEAWAEPAGWTGDERWELMAQLRQIGAALMQLAQHGTPAQLDEAKRLLAELRRALYRVLSEDDAR